MTLTILNTFLMLLSKQNTFALSANVIGSEMVDKLCRSFTYLKQKRC